MEGQRTGGGLCDTDSHGSMAQTKINSKHVRMTVSARGENLSCEQYTNLTEMGGFFFINSMALSKRFS